MSLSLKILPHIKYSIYCTFLIQNEYKYLRDIIGISGWTNIRPGGKTCGPAICRDIKKCLAFKLIVLPSTNTSHIAERRGDAKKMFFVAIYKGRRRRRHVYPK